MWAYIFKDKGTKKLPVSTDEDFDFIIKEYNVFYEQALEYRKLTQRINKFLKIHTGNFAWFKKEMMQDADKENLYRFTWILIRLFERRLDKKGLMSKYTFIRELKFSKNHDATFTNYFLSPDKIGTFLAFIISPAKKLATNYTISGYPFLRLLWSPLGIIFRSFGILRFIWTFFYNLFSNLDWILLGIPYIINKNKTQLPTDYYDTERLIGQYLYGKSGKAKKELRKLVLKDKQNCQAYFSAMWAVFVREKFVEILIDSNESN